MSERAPKTTSTEVLPEPITPPNAEVQAGIITDEMILATPTPLAAAEKPGSETESPEAYEDYNLTEAYLVNAVVDPSKSIGNTGPIYSRPALDTLNTMTMLAHGANNGNTPYRPAEEPTGHMAQDIVKAFPHPRDLVLAVATYLQHMAILNERLKLPPLDIKAGHRNLHMLSQVIYGDRYTAFRAQMAQDLQPQPEQQPTQETQVINTPNAAPATAVQPPTTEATPAVQPEDESLYKYGIYDREVLGNSKSIRIDTRIATADILNSVTALKQAAKNGITLTKPRIAYLNMRKDHAEQKYERKKLRYESGGRIMKKLFYKRSMDKAQKKFTKLTTKHGKLVGKVASRKQHTETLKNQRDERIMANIKRYSEAMIDAKYNKELRAVRKTLKADAIRQGKGILERKAYARDLSPEDKKRIRITATKIAKREAIKKGYRPEGSRWQS